MSRITVSEIMNRVSARVNQDATASPSAGSTEWILWLSFINQTLHEWAEATDWEELVQNYYPAVTGLTQATIMLPDNFRKVAGTIRRYGSSTGTWDNSESYPEVLREQVDLYPATDKWFFITGNESSDFILTINPGTLASGASLAIPYFSIPTSLASPAQIAVLPDDEYFIDRVTAFIFEARSDSRFQEQEAKAREKLLTMIENHDVKKYSGFAGQNAVTNTTRLQGFRWGRD